MIDRAEALRELQRLARRGACADLVVEAQASHRVTVRGDAVGHKTLSRSGVGMGRSTAEGTEHAFLAGRDPGHVSRLREALLAGSMPVPASAGSDADGVEVPAAAGKLVQKLVHDAAQELAVRGGELVSPDVLGEAVFRWHRVWRSDGVEDGEEAVRIELRIAAIARRNRTQTRSLRVVVAGGPLGLDVGVRHLEAARAAADSALRKLDAVAPPTATMPVIFGPGGPAALLHETCGHGLEADVAGCPGSAYGGLLGTRLTGAPLTLVDDPATPAAAPVYGVDDEGEPAAAVTLIEDGVLRSLLHDRTSARAAGVPSSGHGRRLSYGYPALPRLSCTYVAPGPDDPAEILADTPRGLYVASIFGGETDMSAGRFSVQVTEAYLVEDGRLTVPISGATLSGAGLDVLSAIDRIGYDVEFLPHAFQCNKLGQFPLTVSVGQPTIRVAALGVSGS